MSSDLPVHPSNYRLEEASGGAIDAWTGPAVDHGGAQTSPILRYLAAFRRNRWVILGVTAVATLLAMFGSRYVKPVYQAQAILWVEVSTIQSFTQGPIRTGELLQASAWIELLRSYMVLDHVVREQRLFIDTNPAHVGAFESFELRERFRPGAYELDVDPQRGTFVLSANGSTLQTGRLGEKIGEDVGFDWVLPPGYAPQGNSIQFTVSQPRDTAVRLSRELQAWMAEGGNFLRLSLEGTDPERITATLNAIAERYVLVAADLKREKFDQLTAVLEEQRLYAEQALREAEINLEGFRVATVTLPAERGAPVSVGLEMTRDPVMSRFFDMQGDLDQHRNDVESIDRILTEADRSPEAIDGLVMVPAVQESPALTAALTERMEKEAELRALLQRYMPDHPSVVALREDIENLERESIPRLAEELRAQSLAREGELRSRVDAAASELRQIPPRAIEEARLERQVATAENLYSTLKQRYEEARLAAVSTIPDIRALDRAVVPTDPSSDQRLIVMLLGCFGGLGLSLAGVMLFDRFDSRVRYPDEITYGMGLSILGVIPEVKNITGEASPEEIAQAGEAFREIRMNLVHAHGAAGPIMTTITSPGSGDGKSFLSLNLAIAFAEQGFRTLLIDGDIRRGTLHRNLGVPRVPGLTDYLSGQAERADVLRATNYPNVYLIPAGTRLPNGPELLASAEMAKLLQELKHHFGAILLDSPPLGAGVDAFALGTLSRNLLLVMRIGATERAMAVAKLGMLDRLPIRLLGAVLNGASSDTGPYRYYSYLPGYTVAAESLESGA